jgi:hypothetical protein
MSYQFWPEPRAKSDSLLMKRMLRFVLAFRGPASLLTQTDLTRFKPEDREAASKVAAKLKQLLPVEGHVATGNVFGLAVVQQIVLAHGWEIECLPNTPKGAIFRITHLKVAG